MFFFVPSINSIVDQELTQFCGVDMANWMAAHIGKKHTKQEKTHIFINNVNPSDMKNAYFCQSFD